jgi:hypothetical protein
VAVVRDQSRTVGTSTPTEIRIAGGTVLVVGAALVAALAFAPSDLPGRVLLIAAVVGAYAAAVADLRAVAAVSALAAATFVGFLAHRYGQLTGPGHAWSYTVLIGFAAVLGTGYRYLRAISAGHEGTPPPSVRRAPGTGAGITPPGRRREGRRPA